MTGDVVATGPGAAAATIQPNVVTNAKLAQAAADTIKGNNTGSTANVTDLTGSQVTALLSTLLVILEVAEQKVLYLHLQLTLLFQVTFYQLAVVGHM